MLLTLIRKQPNIDNTFRIVQYHSSIMVLNLLHQTALKYFHKNKPIDTFVLLLDLFLTHVKNEGGSKSGLT